MKAHIHSLTADGAEQQKCSRYSRNKGLLSVSERCLNDLNTLKKLFIEFTNFFKVSGCNQFILATFK